MIPAYTRDQSARRPRVVAVSYRSVFILLFTLLLILTTVAVGFNAYRRAVQVSLGLSADIIDQMAEKVADRTVAILEAAYGFLETDALVVPMEGFGPNREQVYRLFWRQLGLSPQIFSIYAADPSGGLIQVRASPQPVTRFIDRGGDGVREQLIYRDRDYNPIAHIPGAGRYDPRERAWYIAGLAAQGNVSWSSVYRFASVDKPGITASKAVLRPDGTPILVLGVDIALQGLSDFLAEQPLAKGAVAMIVDGQDRLVAYPYRLKLTERAAGASKEALPLVSDLASPALVRAYEALKSGAGATQSAGGLKAFEVTRTEGEGYIARIHHFPSHWTEGWKLFVVVPQASLLASAGRLLTESAVISLIILVAALFLVSSFAVRLFKPLRKLVTNTELVREMRFSEVRPVPSRFAEIQSMSEAICGMKQSLENLERFVPSSVVRALVESDGALEPDVQVRELTLVCGGMAELGRLCATLTPERISAVLSAHLDRMTRVLIRLKATVDDYLGESLLAFWGAPSGIKDGPARACQAVLQCLQAEADLVRDGSDYPAEAAQGLYAVHTGPCIVGNIGSKHYMSYTAVGDNVQLTWRLKQLNRVYGTRAIVTAVVRRQIADGFWLRRLDRLPLGGGAEPMDIFELQGARDQALPLDLQLYTRGWEQGLDLLLAGDFTAADRVFADLQSQRPVDPALHLMRRRCSARSPLPCAQQDWPESPRHPSAEP